MLGVGYDYVERVLNGDVVLRMLVLLAVLKIVATAVCYASGNAGGMFGPSLFIGAMVGGAVGTAAHAPVPALHRRTGGLRPRRHGHGVRRHRPHAARRR